MPRALVEAKSLVRNGSVTGEAMCSLIDRLLAAPVRAPFARLLAFAAAVSVTSGLAGGPPPLLQPILDVSGPTAEC